MLNWERFLTTRPRVRLNAVYALVCTVNGRRYIGSSKNVYGRIEGHYLGLRKGTHHARFLQRAFNKHGEHAFRVTLIRVFSDSTKLLECEQYYIDYYRTLGLCYNSSAIAGRPYIPTEQNRAAQKKVAGKHATHAKQQWSDPVIRAKMIAGLVAAAARNKGKPRLAQSAGLRAAWQDPEKGARMLAGVKAGHGKGSKSQASKMRLIWTDLNKRAYIIEQQNIGKTKAGCGQRTSERWLDPVWSARTCKAMSGGWAARNAS